MVSIPGTRCANCDKPIEPGDGKTAGLKTYCSHICKAVHWDEGVDLDIR